jgi:hypothetical protein
MKVSNLRDSKLLQLAERALRMRAHEALIECVQADQGMEATQRFEKALRVVSIPARELGVLLEGNPQAIKSRILQRRILLLRQE